MRRWMCCIAVVLITTTTANAEDWPRWRGPSRDDTTREVSGWDGHTWKIAERWRANVGAGASAPIIVGDRVYAIGYARGKNTVFCLDADRGGVVWSQAYDSPEYGRKSNGDKSMYAGPSATPTFDGDTAYLYTLSTDGDLHCWNTATGGACVWQLNLYDEYDPPQRDRIGRSGQRDYGFTSSPLVLGDQLLVEVGSARGSVIAFDKRSGREVWRSAYTGQAGHTGGLVPMQVGNTPAVAVLTLRDLVVMRVDRGHEGQTIATYPWETDFANSIATPAVVDDTVMITSEYNNTAMQRLRITPGKAARMWRLGEASKVCSPVVYNGYVYWAWNGLRCVNLQAGRQIANVGKIANEGSMIVTGDGKLIVWANHGDLMLYDPARHDRDKPRLLKIHTNVLQDRAWPHVALGNGRLVCRDLSGNLVCFIIGAEPEPAIVQGDGATEYTLANWPAADDSMLLAWKRGDGMRRIAGRINQTDARWRLIRRDQATLADDGSMQLDGGALLAPAGDDLLLSALRGSNQLTVEAVFTSRDLKQAGPARIISFSTDAFHRNFTLGQERDRLVFRLRTPATGLNGREPEIPLGPITAGRTHHVIVTYRPGELTCWLDGRRVLQTDRVRGDFSNWNAQRLLFGDEFKDRRDWAGRLQAVAIYDRAMSDAEAAERHRRAR